MTARPLVISLAAVLCLGSSPPVPGVVDAGTRPLPKELRPFLRAAMMSNHGSDLLQLVAAVTLLQYDDVKAAATRIAEEPRLARATGETLDNPNAAIPARFFELQEALRPRARALASAATRRDDARLGQAMGEMVQACVACHAEYLPRPAPHAAPTRPGR